jgi:amino acid transporter
VSEARSLESFGYRQELNRSLGLGALVVYGLVFINPTSTFSIFGIVFNASHGMVPLVYIVGFGAMMFTALSYVTMSRAFPVAGSVYTYAGRGIGPLAGFIAGWALLIDYVLMPALIYVLCGVAIEALVPEIPRVLSIAVVLALNTAMNLVGIETSARLTAVLLVLTLAFLALFFVLGGYALAHGVAGAHVSFTPLFQPDAFAPALVFGALSIATLNFLGFDGVSTLVEEARGGAQAVGRAMLLALGLAAVLFVAQTWLTSLFVLDRSRFSPREVDGAFYGIAALIGGTWFKVIASSKVLVAGFAVAAASQIATARLMYGMARDGRLPRVLAQVHETKRIPNRAILVVAAVALATGLLFANRLELLTSLVSFGALVGFLLLHVSVIVHFWWRERSGRWVMHLLVPVIGGAVVLFVLANMSRNAQTVGVLWLAAGFAVSLASRKKWSG